MGNILGKVNMNIQLKEPKEAYKLGEQIDFILQFQSNKVFKDIEIKVVFKGTSHHQDLFQVRKILSVNKWNNKASLNQIHDVPFHIASPIDVTLPKDGSGEYTVEAEVVVLGYFGKSIKSKTSIQIPLH